MEKAREVFASLEGLNEVQIAAVPGVRELLQVRARADHDWAKTSAAAAPQWRLLAFRADDAALNVVNETNAQVAAAVGAMAVRQHAWAVAGESEPTMRAERFVVRAIEQLEQHRGAMWDPRLDEVAAIAHALRQFWRAVAPALPDDADAPKLLDAPLAAAVPTLPERVGAALARQTAAPSPELEDARAILGRSEPRLYAMILCWMRVADVCAAVRDHAQRAAERTNDAARREAYRDFARRCADLAAAAELLRPR